ncbi:hypothetical protein [Streptomyces sp. NPDC051677]|uniref:hypothetical protein n=1 Tax=Streptomyces sp. NPDC051677 TaxID=3365669 RepID=UPI0037D885A4
MHQRADAPETTYADLLAVWHGLALDDLDDLELTTALTVTAAHRGIALNFSTATPSPSHGAGWCSAV